MAALEPPRHLAAAVSGGRDSLALALLAGEWCRDTGRTLVCLTVDHGLRPNSASEAELVGRWLRRRGLPHTVLHWRGEKPGTAIQAVARRARYRLLLESCRAAGISALLLAHQQEDQAETYLMRLARGGGDGLAAMAPRTMRDGVALLRPLLGVARARLAATLEARGQPWLDDPSNEDPRFERTRMRALVAELGAERLAGAAETARRAREALDRRAAELAARTVTVHPGGWATLDPAAFGDHPSAPRALRRLLHMLGGGEYAPALAAVQRLLPDLGRRGRTLGGCRILPWRGSALICREDRGVPPPAPVVPGARLLWDRFAIELDRSAPAGLTLGPLGAERPSAALAAPAAARPTLPCFRRGAEIAALPALEDPPPWLRGVSLRRGESGLRVA